jgi:hypothetical protein
VGPPVGAAVCDGGGQKAEKPRLIDVFRSIAAEYRSKYSLTPEQGRLLRDMERCRTAALGGRLYRCDHCQFEVPLYNSCGNRGCPNCQALEQARWIAARSARILPVGHHHVVFTLPSELRPLAGRHPRELYGLLLQTAGSVLTSLGEERLGVRLGATLVLHTWTRELLLHPHVHCVVTAGGLTLDGKKWLDRKGFLFAVAQLKAVFRARMLAGLDRLRRGGQVHLDDDPKADADAWKRLFLQLPKAGKWVVYTEAPFGRSTHVLQYLGRYTHRIGLSDQRLVAVSEQAVTFRTRGDATVTLHPLELLRRYLRHVLPAGLNKIRHVGLYAAVHVKGALAVARQLLGGGDQVEPTPEPQPPAQPEQPETWAELLGRLSGDDPLVCPQCRQGRLLVEAVLQCARAPPGAKP